MDFPKVYILSADTPKEDNVSIIQTHTACDKLSRIHLVFVAASLEIVSVFLQSQAGRGHI